MSQKIEQFYNSLPLLRRMTMQEGLPFHISALEIHDIPIHFHDNVQLLFLLKGEVEIKISYDQYSMQAGDFLLINPYEVHSLTPITDDNLLVSMHIQLEQFYTELFIFDQNYYKYMEQEVMREMKLLLAETYSFTITGRRDKARKNFERIVSICDHSYPLYRYNIAEKKLVPHISNQAIAARINNMYKYIYLNFTDKIQLNTFAQNEHIDKFYASRLVRQVTGDSFQNAVNAIRVDRVEPYLLGTDMAIQEIYPAIGFSSYDYFNNQFKDFVGMTPSSYRKKYKPLTYPQKEMSFRSISLSETELHSLLESLDLPFSGNSLAEIEGLLINHLRTLEKLLAEPSLDRSSIVDVEKTPQETEAFIRGSDGEEYQIMLKKSK